MTLRLVSFRGLVTLIENWDILDVRSRTLATYALCGYANLGSVAIQIGGIGGLVPERRTDLAILGVRSMLGGLLTCYTTAAVVGILLKTGGPPVPALRSASSRPSAKITFPSSNYLIKYG